MYAMLLPMEQESAYSFDQEQLSILTIVSVTYGVGVHPRAGCGPFWTPMWKLRKPRRDVLLKPIGDIRGNSGGILTRVN